MNEPGESRQHRILVIDDNAAIHSDFRKILGGQPTNESRLDDLEKALFGLTTNPVERASFRIDSAFQGKEALEMVQRALQENDPYMMAFVDIRMPPGWDGVETLEKLWQCCPELQAVICTAHSDYSWDDIAHRLGQRDSLLILKKPFDTAEVLQIAHALTQKWVLATQAKLRMEDLNRMVLERTKDLQKEVEQRARVQEALRVSEERFSQAFMASPMPIAIQNQPEGRFVDANASFLELTGYAAEQLLERTNGDLRLWDDKAVLPKVTDAQGRLRKCPALLRRRDGATRNILLWAEPIGLQTGTFRLVVVEDVTEHLRLEAQLRQSQKLEAVGCLAAGIAHEFNNLLTVIQGHTGLLSGKSLATKTAAESIARIAQASQRAASLTRRLLAFSHKQPMQLKLVNLSQVTQGLCKMLNQLIGERHQLKLDCPPDLPPVKADEGNVEQILINLVLNARDAMENGGAIAISTRLVTLDAATASLNLEARPGQFVCLTVSDTGCGMTREVLRRIFDPFYTTKEVGKGTGLGLSTVHGIVQQHRGWIEVTTEVGQGSAFNVFLPPCEEACSMLSPMDGAHGHDTQPGGVETVLMVEDEGIVREAARLALERSGYRVFEAAHGPDALRVWDRCPARVDLLVTDMVMPEGVSGGALARLLQERDPHLRVLYTSGYGSEVIREDGHLILGVNFLRKPYDPAALLRAVRLCLDTQAPGTAPPQQAPNGAPACRDREHVVNAPALTGA
jgi:two-component system, cell cycle sensor histidine kinase and response regulator CckA